MLSAIRAARAVSRQALTSASTISAVRAVPALARLTPAINARLLSTSAVLREYQNQNQGFASRAPQRQVHPPSNTVFAGNLPWEATEEHIRNLFEPYGAINAVRIGMTADGRHRGFAHVEFSTVDSATAAVEGSRSEPLYMGDRDIRLDYAPGRQNPVNPPYHKLYISGFTGTEADLRSVFGEYEHLIVGTHMLRSTQTNDLIGTGFVDFMSTERATEVLKAMNGTESPFGQLNLAYARQPRPRQTNGDNWGRGGGGGGRDGGYGSGGRQQGGGGYGGNRDY